MGTQGANVMPILVVDDDPAISRLIRQNLENNGTSVTEANSGLEGLMALHERKIGLVILDINLPDFSGWGILSLIRLTEPLRHMPVIIASVNPPETTLMQQLKPDGYVRKPFDINDLLGCVRDITRFKNVGQMVKSQPGQPAY